MLAGRVCTNPLFAFPSSPFRQSPFRHPRHSSSGIHFLHPIVIPANFWEESIQIGNQKTQWGLGPIRRGPFAETKGPRLQGLNPAHF